METIIIFAGIAFVISMVAFFTRKKKSTIPLTANGLPKFTGNIPAPLPKCERVLHGIPLAESLDPNYRKKKDIGFYTSQDDPYNILSLVNLSSENLIWQNDSPSNSDSSLEFGGGSFGGGGASSSWDDSSSSSSSDSSSYDSGSSYDSSSSDSGSYSSSD